MQFLTASVFFLGQVEFEKEVPVSSVDIQRADGASLTDHYVHLMNKDEVILATASFDGYMSDRVSSKWGASA